MLVFILFLLMFLQPSLHSLSEYLLPSYWFRQLQHVLNCLVCFLSVLLVNNSISLVIQQSCLLQTCMITGDNPLTACHIAKELRMTRKSHTLILTEPHLPEDTWQWKSVDSTVSLDVSSSNLSQLKAYDLCITGEVCGLLECSI